MTIRDIWQHPAQTSKTIWADWDRIQGLEQLRALDEAEKITARRGMRIARGPNPKRGSERNVHRTAILDDRICHLVLVDGWWYRHGRTDAECFRVPYLPPPDAPTTD